MSDEMRHCGFDRKEYNQNQDGGRIKVLYKVIIPNLGKRFCNLQIRSIVLFVLHSSVTRHFSKNNGVSRIIPIGFWGLACFTLLLDTSGDAILL